MADFETGEIELLSAVYTKLRNDPGLAELIPDGTEHARIRDINNLPEDIPMPYVALGPHQRFNDQRSFGRDGQRIVFTLEIWGSYLGRLEVLKVQRLIYLALADEDLTLDSFRCPGGCTSEQGILQPDNSTGVQLMHYIDSYSAIVKRI